MEHFMEIINQLALEHKSDLSFYDIDNFQNARAQMIGEGVSFSILQDPSKYCQYIDKALE